MLNMTSIGLFQKISYLHNAQIIIKKCFTFFSPSIRMSGKSINFEDKKIKKII